MPAGARVNLPMNSSSHQKALGQVAEGGRFDAPQQLGQAFGVFVDLGGLADHEVPLVHFVRPGPADAVDDQLHGALEQLGAAIHQDVVAVVEVLVVLFASIPQPRVDRTAAVGQLQLQVIVAVAVGPQVLIGGDKHLMDVFVMSKLRGVAARHGRGIGG